MCIRDSNKADSSVDEKKKFPSFLKFLLEQRKILEYETDNLRSHTKSDPKSNCWLHDTSNHNISSCNLFHSKSHEERVNAVRTSEACWSCLQTGHISSDCKNHAVMLNSCSHCVETRSYRNISKHVPPLRSPK